MIPNLDAVNQDGSLPLENPAGCDDSAQSCTTEESVQTVANWTDSGRLYEWEWTLTVTPAQQERWKLFVKPKPQRGGDIPDDRILADHRSSVLNVMIASLNMWYPRAVHHDERKLEQGENHAAEEDHHWTFDDTERPWPGVGTGALLEAHCDYIATIGGRAMAGRPFDILAPTSKISAASMLMSGVAEFIQYYDLGTFEFKRADDSSAQEGEYDKVSTPQ